MLVIFFMNCFNYFLINSPAVKREKLRSLIALGVNWAGLHDNVPGRPSGKVAPVGCQLATMALKMETVNVRKGELHNRQKLIAEDCEF